MLGIRIHAEVSLQLLEQRAEQFYNLLKRIPATIELVHADESLINEHSAAWELWKELYKIDGVGSTIAAKLLARKRPALLPVYDEIIRATLRRPEPDFTFWSDLRNALRADEPDLYARLQEVRDQVEPARHLSVIRVFDIVIWMYGRRGTASCP